MGHPAPKAFRPVDGPPRTRRRVGLIDMVAGVGGMALAVDGSLTDRPMLSVSGAFLALGVASLGAAVATRGTHEPARDMIEREVDEDRDLVADIVAKWMREPPAITVRELEAQIAQRVMGSKATGVQAKAEGDVLDPDGICQPDPGMLTQEQVIERLARVFGIPQALLTSPNSKAICAALRAHGADSVEAREVASRLMLTLERYRAGHGGPTPANPAVSLRSLRLQPDDLDTELW